MFTGIVSDIGTITRVEQRGDMRVTIRTAYDPASIDLGASISCSGVCLTVIDKGSGMESNWFAVDVSGETIARTAAGQWSAGRRLNLERALKLGEELGGHIVTGHVDGVGEITSLGDVGGSKRVEIVAGSDIAPFVAEKGSITIDGVSLTVNSVADAGSEVTIGVNIIPHTGDVTTFAGLAVGQSVNIEIDVLARYLGRMRAFLPS